MRKNIIAALFIFANSFCTYALVPVLEREINLSLNNEKVSVALIKIQEQAGLVFSYQPALIENLDPVSFQLKRKTVREVLALLLPKNIIYKPRNNYIILKEKPVEKSPKKTEISGYVIDKNTEQKVANVTIYDKQSLQSVTTDEYGFYSISVPSGNDKISINKENYEDTVVALSAIQDEKIVNITLKPETKLFGKSDSTHWKNKLQNLNDYTHQIFGKFKSYVNTLNIKDTLTRKWQVSLFPYVGTNHKLSGNVVNKLSFNLYGGFAKGVNGFEAGGIFNIDRKNVKGVQLAGMFNIVGDSAQGTQCAGLFNINGKAFKGFQAAGLMNINDGSHTGVQLASLMNINGRVHGTSAAGMMNISGKVKGVQLAGMANINDTLLGVAAAGLFNISKYGKNLVQVAPLFNVTDNGSSAVQLAALFNRTTYLKGVQLAFLNFSDSAKGVPIGFLSFVKKGVHQIELSADELFPYNLSFRTGVPKFYNIFSAGIQGGSSLWHVGYGVGTSFKLKNKLHIEANGTVHHLSQGTFYSAVSDLYRIYAGVEYKFRKKFSIAAGPMLNIYVSDTYDTDYEGTYSQVAPYSLSNTTSIYGFNTKMWVGGKIALRFL